jgi:hypothetical protein
VNLEQYNAVCEACDQLLLAPDSSIERIAIPWLHVIRAHPIFLEGYRGIFAQQTGQEGKRHVRNFASALRHLGTAFVCGGPLWSSVNELPQKCDVLMVSHLVNEAFTGQEGDFYFGKAAGELADLGISATIALINYTETSPLTLAGRWRQAKIPRVIFSPVLSLTAEWALYRRVLAEARRIKSFAATQTNDLICRVATRASLEAVSGGAVSALRLGEQIKALVARLQPRAIVVTYEGHSWERIAFAAARAVSPQICCIGYQHAALFNLQHAVQRRLADDCNPDAILTSGRVSQARLQNNPQLKGVLIEVLGSNRSFARQAARVWGTESSERRACLVLPEGIVSECNLLFGFALQCARRMPDIVFIWRLHPNMSYGSLTRQNPVFRELPSNIILSTRALAEDIARSHWALYRGSTAIVQAAVSGVRPVYLHQTGEIPIDTLYEIADLHAQVVEPDDFMALVTETEASDASTKAERVQNYCERMFTPMDTRALAACITGAQKGISEVL